ATGSGATSDPILMDGPKTAIGLFGTEYYLEVQSTYGTVSGTGWYASGTPAVATAPSIVPVSSGSRRAFNGWSGDASGSSTTSAPIIMNGPKLATANWKLQYNLRIDTAYGTPLTAGWYDAGTQTTARLDVGTISLGSGAARQAVAGWRGDATGSSGTLSSPIVMDGPKTAHATWTVQYLVRVDSDIQVQIDGGGWYAVGTQATLRAPQEVAYGGQTYR